MIPVQIVDEVKNSSRVTQLDDLVLLGLSCAAALEVLNRPRVAPVGSVGAIPMQPLCDVLALPLMFDTAACVRRDNSCKQILCTNYRISLTDCLSVCLPVCLFAWHLLYCRMNRRTRTSYSNCNSFVHNKERFQADSQYSR